MNLCREYDQAAIVRIVDDKPEWHSKPPRVHISAELAEDEGAGEFLRTAYRLSDGCHPSVLHGDRIEAGA